jgi:hypothetical protein
MGQQDGLIKLKGSVGEVTFYKAKDGSYFARKKSGVTADRMRTDPKYARTRENWDEFRRASDARKLLRIALRSLTTSVADNKVNGRLHKQMMLVVKADKTSVRGARNVVNGEAELLAGFEFNQNSPLSTTFFAPYTSTIDRAAGNLSVAIPAFNASEMIIAPPGATHYRLIAGAAEVDFETNTFVVNDSKSTDISLTAPAQDALELSQVVTAASTKPLFLVFGIVFLQEVNGAMSKLQNGAFNALAIVAVDGGA